MRCCKVAAWMSEVCWSQINTEMSCVVLVVVVVVVAAACMQVNFLTGPLGQLSLANPSWLDALSSVNSCNVNVGNFFAVYVSCLCFRV